MSNVQKNKTSKCWWLQEGTLAKLTIILHINWTTGCNLCIPAPRTKVRSPFGLHSDPLSWGGHSYCPGRRAGWEWSVTVSQLYPGIRPSPGVLTVKEMDLFHFISELMSHVLAFSLLLSHFSHRGPQYTLVNPNLRSSMSELRKTDLWTLGNCEVLSPGPWLNGWGVKTMNRTFRSSNRIGTKVKSDVASAFQ